MERLSETDEQLFDKLEHCPEPSELGKVAIELMNRQLERQWGLLK